MEYAERVNAGGFVQTRRRAVDGVVRAPFVRLKEGAVMTRETSRRDHRRWRSEHGTSAVEYALIVAGAAVALVGGVVVLSGGLKTAYEASAQGAEAGVTVDEEAAGSNDQAAVPAETATPSPSDIPTATPTPSPTPTPTPSATKTSATPTPSPTRPKDAISVSSGEDADPVDIGAPKEVRGFTATVDPEWAGDAYINGDGELVFDASKQAEPGTLVTVTWAFSKGGKLYQGTTTYWITPG
jgi:Flp pilus assembly pilin Flp